MNLSYPAVKALLDPFFHTYQCRDGRAFYVVAVAHAVHQERCLKALGVWDALVQLGLPRGDCWRDSDQWEQRCILGTFPLTDAHWIQTIKTHMAAAFLTKASADWEQIFAEQKIPGALVRTTRESKHLRLTIANALNFELLETREADRMHFEQIEYNTTREVDRHTRIQQTS